MIRHIVLIKFKSEVEEATIETLFHNLATLTQKLDGASGFTGGKSKSPEHIERGYMHGFVIDFDAWETLNTYQKHPDHIAVSDGLLENAQGGIDGILVLDLEV